LKIITLLLLTFLTLNAQSFSKQTLLGEWELSSAKLNSAVFFGRYIGKQRNGTITLLFNKTGFLKVLQTGEVYNYEVVQGELKIYETKEYKYGYKVRRKSQYDLFKIVGSVDGCLEVKLTKKKIPGYKPKRNLKMCKLSNFPEPTYQESISKYRF
jgi:hypothetical protein